MKSRMSDAAVLRATRNCLKSNYGITGDLKRLPGENLNYLVTTGAGRQYVAKLVDEDMPSDIISLAAEVIGHALGKVAELELPKILENKNGNIETRIKSDINKPIRLHVMEFLTGNVLHGITDISEKLLADSGRILARFDLALADFDHPAAHRNHRWNLAKANQHRDSIRLLSGPEQRELLSWAFDTWERKAAARFHELPHQVIHGDAFTENLLVRDDKVTGLVDFGDCCYNPTICELAICLTYLMMEREDPVPTAAVITRGYHEVRPLSEAELDVLLPLVCGRLAVTLAVSAERKLIDPDNPNWFEGEGPARRLIRKLRSTGIDAARDHLARLL
ncbi:MAG: phosphotransferase [Xanthomonadales bacterium]|nr:phosphotransferase [Xanthomonadales bacterium]